MQATHKYEVLNKIEKLSPKNVYFDQQSVKLDKVSELYNSTGNSLVQNESLRTHSHESQTHLHFVIVIENKLLQNLNLLTNYSLVVNKTVDHKNISK